MYGYCKVTLNIGKETNNKYIPIESSFYICHALPTLPSSEINVNPLCLNFPSAFENRREFKF
jgi:hypothetical protein